MRWRRPAHPRSEIAPDSNKGSSQSSEQCHCRCETRKKLANCVAAAEARPLPSELLTQIDGLVGESRRGLMAEPGRRHQNRRGLSSANLPGTLGNGDARSYLRRDGAVARGYAPRSGRTSNHSSQGEATARTPQISCASCRETGGRRPCARIRQRLVSTSSIRCSSVRSLSRHVEPCFARLASICRVFHSGFVGISIPLGIGCARNQTMSFQYSGSSSPWMMPRCKVPAAASGA